MFLLQNTFLNKKWFKDLPKWKIKLKEGKVPKEIPFNFVFTFKWLIIFFKSKVFDFLIFNFGKIHIIFTIPVIFKYTVQEYLIHSHCCSTNPQQSSSCKIETLYQLDNTMFSPRPLPGSNHSSSCLYEFKDSRYLL